VRERLRPHVQRQRGGLGATEAAPITRPSYGWVTTISSSPVAGLPASQKGVTSMPLTLTPRIPYSVPYTPANP
jgi:hypothetical protein